MASTQERLISENERLRIELKEALGSLKEVIEELKYFEEQVFLVFGCKWQCPHSVFQIGGQ